MGAPASDEPTPEPSRSAPLSGLQLRRYEIRPGAMEDFVDAWGDLASIRRRHGFTIVAAVVDEDASEFVWIVHHPGDFADAERIYYADAEREVVGARASPHVVRAHVSMVHDVGREPDETG
jgi:hypothetical protein